jgi:hypothetical protein
VAGVKEISVFGLPGAADHEIEKGVLQFCIFFKYIFESRTAAFDLVLENDLNSISAAGYLQLFSISSGREEVS